MTLSLKRHVILLPFPAADAGLEQFREGAEERRLQPMGLRSKRLQLTTGSIRLDILRGQARVAWIDLFALNEHHTVIDVYNNAEQQEVHEALDFFSEFAISFLQLTAKWSAELDDRFLEERERMQREMPSITKTTPLPKLHEVKRGPRPLKVNEWARQESAGGKTIDEILPEYARRRRMNPVEARELLRKALNRSN